MTLPWGRVRSMATYMDEYSLSYSIDDDARLGGYCLHGTNFPARSPVATCYHKFDPMETTSSRHDTHKIHHRLSTFEEPVLGVYLRDRSVMSRDPA